MLPPIPADLSAVTGLLACAGLTLLCVGGDALVRGASALALRFGLSPLAVGLTVVAFGTSAPELVVSLGAALSGAADIAVGNVVGSNIANVALILGLAALVRPASVHSRVLKLDGPLVLLVSLGLLAALIDGEVSRPEGFALLVGLLVYVTHTLRSALREPAADSSDPEPLEAPRPAHLRKSLAFILGGLAGLMLGGHLLVNAAVEAATALGVSEATIGLTVVAVGTSLPELATSVVAAWRGQGDIAVGNVVGSNLFNILGILGTTALVTPLPLGNVGWFSLWTMVALALLLLPLLLTRSRVSRWEGGLLVACYASYLIVLLGAETI